MTRSHWQRPDGTELHAMQQRVAYGTRLRPLAWLMAALLAAAAAPVAAAPAQPAAHTAVAPQTVNPEVMATAIAVGSEHSCALLATGGVKCWGSNRGDQLGDIIYARRGDGEDRRSPVPVLSLESGVIGIRASGMRSFALMANGATKQWGGVYFTGLRMILPRALFSMSWHHGTSLVVPNTTVV